MKNNSRSTSSGSNDAPLHPSNDNYSNEQQKQLKQQKQSRKTANAQDNNAQRRKQVRRACVNCRKSHACCDDARPCQRCVKLGLQDLCEDVKHEKRGRKRRVTNDTVQQYEFGTCSFFICDVFWQ